MQIEIVTADHFAAAAPELAEVLVDCVDGGASVGFVSPLDVDEAHRWWSVALAVDGAFTFVARDGDGPVLGVVQLRLASPANGSHRAEVAKLLVRRDARGQGVARALLDRLEGEALLRGRWLLTLDTRTGSPAELLYQKHGWNHVGVIPDWAVDPDGTLSATTIMTKRLDSVSGG